MLSPRGVGKHPTEDAWQGSAALKGLEPLQGPQSGRYFVCWGNQKPHFRALQSIILTHTPRNSGICLGCSSTEHRPMNCTTPWVPCAPRFQVRYFPAARRGSRARHAVLSTGRSISSHREAGTNRFYFLKPLPRCTLPFPDGKGSQPGSSSARNSPLFWHRRQPASNASIYKRVP